jgi:hypothetical protein
MYEYAYQVKLSASGDNQDLLNALEKIAGMRGLTYTNQEAGVEI